MSGSIWDKIKQNYLLRKIAFVLPTIIIFGLCFYALRNLLLEFSFEDLTKEIRRTPAVDILIAVILCVLNFFVLTFYDKFALDYTGHKLSYKRIGFASTIGYAFSQNLGFAIISGGAVRMRLYSYWGIPAASIAKVIVFCTLHFWAGLFMLGGISILVYSEDVQRVLKLPFPYGTIIGLCCLLPIVGYLILSLTNRRKVRAFGKNFEIPTFKIAGSALSVACLDWIIAASVLYVLFPANNSVTFAEMLLAFLVAQLLAVMTHVPGGVGVFETIMIALLKQEANQNTLLGTLILYRAVYYLLPFTVALISYGYHELARKGFRAGQIKEVPIYKFSVSILPRVMGISVFLAGLVLLVSGAVPTAKNRVWWVQDVVPSYFLEFSHFTNSLTGVALLLVSWGLFKKLAGAHKTATFLVVLGVITSILKGLDYEEAIFLILVSFALYVSKDAFYRRRDSLPKLGARQIALTVCAITASVWLGFFSYKEVNYSNSLWWEFEGMSDAPRFLRGSVAAALTLIAFTLYTYIYRKPVKKKLPDPNEMEHVKRILEGCGSTEANLALMKDKFFFFNENLTAFIMYQVEGQTWIAMGDPVSVNPDDNEDLIWSFYEAADEEMCECAFYEVSIDNLPTFIDLGERAYKIGEKAIVDLKEFNLEGAKSKVFRNTLRKLEKEGLNFQIISKEDVADKIEELKSVSDIWLAEKKNSEKGFSLGFFETEYLMQMPCAVVKKDHKIIAFANIWDTANKNELSLDLMRYLPEAYNGIMDYLFLNLMLWGKENNYKYFNLGMAPFSGLETRRVSSLWNRMIAFIFEHGENFYNFEGLRKYKNKFSPMWEPSYLICSSGFQLPFILKKVNNLVSRVKRQK